MGNQVTRLIGDGHEMKEVYHAGDWSKFSEYFVDGVLVKKGSVLEDAIIEAWDENWIETERTEHPDSITDVRYYKLVGTIKKVGGHEEPAEADLAGTDSTESSSGSSDTAD